MANSPLQPCHRNSNRSSTADPPAPRPVIQPLQDIWIDRHSDGAFPPHPLDRLPAIWGLIDEIVDVGLQRRYIRFP